MKKIIRFLPLFIFIAAFLMRVWGVNPGFPDNHPDEGTSYQSAIYMLYHFLVPPRYDYPAGLPLTHLVIFIIFILPFVLLKMFVTHPSYLFDVIGQNIHFFGVHQVDIFGPRNIHALYWSRYISAVLGTGGVILVYFTGKAIFNKRVGLFAALFLAFNFRHVLASHFALPEPLNSFINLLSLFVSYKLLTNPSKKKYLLAGIVAGIGFSLKYQIFAFFPLLAAHLLLTIQKKRISYLFNSSFIKACLVFLLTYFLINPFYLFNLKEAIRQNSGDFHRYQMGIYAFRPYHYFYIFHWGIGEVVSVGIALGVILMLITNFRKSLMVLSLAFPFVFVFTIFSNGGVYPRNWVSVMPYLMLFAGYFADSIYVGLKKIRFPFSGVLIGIIAILAIVPSIKNTIALDDSYSKPWGITVVSNWIDTHLPSNITVRFYNFLYGKLMSLQSKNVIAKYWVYEGGPNSLAEFQEEGTDFAILNTQPFQAITYFWRGWDDPRRMFSYKGVPFEYIENSFFGLTIKELRQYTVFETYKPWQATDESNYLVFKIPKKPTNVGKQIQSYTFDNNSSMWKKVNPFNFAPLDAGWTGTAGNVLKGALLIQSGGDATQRLSSPVIKVTPGKIYTIRAFIKAPKIPIVKKPYIFVDSDGFIRLDMYKDANHLDQLGEVVALSPRALKTGEWQEEDVSLVAPKDAAYMSISLQRKSFTDGPIYFDDIIVFEGDEKPEEPFKDLPYIKSTIPLESLYYNTFI